MKTLSIAILFLLVSGTLFAQDDQFDVNENVALTIGILQGGGSLLGADIEFLVADGFGIQVGGGFVGVGAGLNYHFKPTVRSSYLSLQYWHQGLGDSYVQSVLGPNFVFRAKKIFQAQIGAGFSIGNGPAATQQIRDTNFMLMYAIGLYFPL